jgi:hypothetical protein
VKLKKNRDASLMKQTNKKTLKLKKEKISEGLGTITFWTHSLYDNYLKYAPM